MKEVSVLPLKFNASNELMSRVGIALIVAVFLWVYWPFLFALRFAFIAPDSYVYYAIGRDAVGGLLDTELRTPLFPLLVFLTSEYVGPFWLAAAQCVIFLFSVCFVFHALLRKFGPWSFLPALAFGLMAGSSQLIMKYNMFLLTESLFGSCCLLYVGVLVSRFDRLNNWGLLILSLISVVAFLIRNTGEIFLLTNLVLVIFRRDLWSGFAKKLAIAVGPIAAAVLLICVHNYVYAGFFAPTVLSIGARAYLSVPLWQPTPRLTDDVNRFVEGLSSQVDKADLAVLRESNNPQRIMQIRHRYDSRLSPVNAVYEFLFNKDNKKLEERIEAQTGYQTARGLTLYLAGRISDEAIDLNRWLYYKLVAANLYFYCCGHFRWYNTLTDNLFGEEFEYMVRVRNISTESPAARVFYGPAFDACAESCVVKKPGEVWTTDLSKPATRHVASTMRFMRRLELGPWGFIALIVSALAGIGLLVSGFRDRFLHVIVVVASIYVFYIFGMGLTGSVYEIRLMVPMVAINYFLSLVGAATVLCRAFLMYRARREAFAPEPVRSASASIAT